MIQDPSASAREPLFSIIISTLDRAQIVQRCIESCFIQDFDDYEVIVVDDGSRDGTPDVLRSRWGSSITVIEHGENRGINPARATGATAARGRWLVVLDSDWALAPGALMRLHQIVSSLPPDVGAVRTQMLWDDRQILPAAMPAGIQSYAERIRFASSDGGSDMGRCFRRDVIATVPFIEGRRGAMELLFELNLARATNSLFLREALFKQYSDAPNSYLRSKSARTLVPRLLLDAPDMQWMVATVLGEHGAALQTWGPAMYRTLLKMGVTQALLAGNRRSAWRYVRALGRRREVDALTIVTLSLGLLAPKAVALGTVLFRYLRPG